MVVAEGEDHFLVTISVEFCVLKELQFEAMLTGDATADGKSQTVVSTHLFESLREIEKMFVVDPRFEVGGERGGNGQFVSKFWRPFVLLCPVGLLKTKAIAQFE